jgi:hypothetical protein
LNSSESNTAPDLSISRSDVLYSPSAEHVAPGPGNMRWLAATPRRVPGVVHGPTLYRTYGTSVPSPRGRIGQPRAPGTGA